MINSAVVHWFNQFVLEARLHKTCYNTLILRINKFPHNGIVREQQHLTVNVRKKRMSGWLLKHKTCFHEAWININLKPSFGFKLDFQRFEAAVYTSRRVKWVRWGLKDFSQVKGQSGSSRKGRICLESVCLSWQVLGVLCRAWGLAFVISFSTGSIREAMRLVSAAGVRLRRAAEEEREKEREPPPPQPPSHHSNHQFTSMKNKFFNELTHLPSEARHTTHTRMMMFPFVTNKGS